MRILVVDDDQAVRAFLKIMLSDYGHDVVECWNGIQGLATFERKGPFDAVLSDGQMPGLTGPEMTARIRELNADIPIVVLSGDEAMAGRLSGGIIFLEKGRASMAEVRTALGLNE